VSPRSGSKAAVSSMSRNVHNIVTKTDVTIQPTRNTDIRRYRDFLVGEYDKRRRTATGGGVVRGENAKKSEGDIRCVIGVMSPLLRLPEDTELGDGLCGEEEPTRGVNCFCLILLYQCKMRMMILLLRESVRSEKTTCTLHNVW
jgi:hypothetical protein